MSTTCFRAFSTHLRSSLSQCGQRSSSKSAIPFLSSQRRHARVLDQHFYATHSNTQALVHDRYAQKLARKARELGLPDTQALLSAKKQEKRHKPNGESHIKPPLDQTSAATDSSQSYNSPFPPPPPAPQPTSASTSRTATPPGIKSLSSYLDLEKIAKLPATEIGALWRLRFAQDPQSLAAVVPAETYKRQVESARLFPSFVLPLPRDNEQGSDQSNAKKGPEAAEKSTQSNPVELHFLQHGFPSANVSTIIFTTLAEYKLRGEFANPHTTLTYHVDLAESHGIVLMCGNVASGEDGKQGQVTVEQAQWLVVCLQRFYAGMGQEQSVGRRRQLLEQFTKGDGGFDVRELIEEAEKLT